MNAKKLAIELLLVTALLAPSANAQEDAHHHEPEPIAGHEIRLSPELGQLLAREMIAIQSGMQALVPAIAAGEWGEVAEIGQRIHDSYILKQELSEAQSEELHHALPQAFKELDHSFHHSAGMLAHAAENKNADVVNFYFFKLNQGCVACHAKYATRRFPGLAGGEPEPHH